jgi:two-component system, NtrC family, sensor kinase
MTGKPSDEAPLSPRRTRPSASGPRASLDADAPTLWLEQIFDLHCDLPVDTGLEELLDQFLDRLAPLLPACAVGACVVDTRGQPLVVLRMPPGSDGDPGRDPTRLFPRLSLELVLPLGPELAGSTLHLASDDTAIMNTGSNQARIVRAAARVLNSAVRQVLALARARESSADLHRLQAQVIQAEKLASLGQIVAGVVHELNNPLTSIVAYSDYLRKRAIERAAEPEDVERLRRIGEAAERILKFSRDLVAYARPSSDIPAPVMLREVVDKALVFCEHEFGESQVEIDCSIPVSLPPVRGIAGQLTQLFVNLFTNAAHAMNTRGGRLTINASPRGTDAMLVEVADEGVGIEAGDLEQIFEPFFTTKTDGRGTGLGLSIVREIVEAHAGTLSARSTPGKGSVFSVVLPLAAVPPSLAPPPKSEP